METNYVYDVRSGRPLADFRAPPISAERRPRERMLAFGPQSLSDKELLAVLLNAGIKGKSVEALAEELSELLDGGTGIPDVRELQRLAGLGHAKACAVAAMIEYGRRRWGPCGTRVRSPSDVYQLVRHYADRKQERFICVSLNGASETLAVRVVTVGNVNKTLVHPREVFADPLTDRACSILVAHNHPSGKLDPSAEDEDITARLVSTGDILGIRVADHLVFSDTGYYSFLQAGRIK